MTRDIMVVLKEKTWKIFLSLWTATTSDGQAQWLLPLWGMLVVRNSVSFLPPVFAPLILRSHAVLQEPHFFDNRIDLKDVKIPSLTLQCREDIIAPEQIGEFVEKNMPQNILHVMRATGHCPHISEPEETVSAIKNFLK